MKDNMKKILVQLTIAIVSSPINSKAQGVGEVITTGASISKQVCNAVSWIYSHQEQVKMIFRGFHYNHRWWACIYRDGFVTYNNFRSYRNSMDAYNYFVLGHGDCDAVYGDQNNHICYENPLQAKRYTDEHGEIVDIQYQDSNGNYRSIYDY